MKNKIIVVLTIFAALMTSCATHNGIYSDVIGFSSKVDNDYLINKSHRGRFKNLFKQKKPSNLTEPQSAKIFKNNVDVVPKNMRLSDTSNTALYYAVETACDRIRYVRKRVMKRDKGTEYYIFAATDGLDNWSSQAALEDGQTLFRVKPNKYPKRVQRKLKWAMGFGKNKFEVYPMVKDGQDLRTIQTYNNMTEEQYEAYIPSMMECIRYSSKGKEKAPEVIFKKDYNAIFTELSSHFETSSYSFLVPKGYRGERIRMNLISDKGEKASLEATFRKKCFKYVLSDIELKGININKESIFFKKNGTILNPSVRSLKAYKEGAVKFKIEKITSSNDGKKYDVNGNNVTQDHNTNGIWAQNTEYGKQASKNKNVYFIFVVDASGSLNEKDFNAEMDMVKRITDKMIEVSN